MLIPNDTKVYLHTGITDMRKSINTLAILVQEVMEMSPSNGALYLFRSRCATKLKALYYYDNSYSLWYRRLEKGKFIFPRNITGNIELSEKHLEWLLASNKYTHLKSEADENYQDFV